MRMLAAALLLITCAHSTPTLTGPCVTPCGMVGPSNCDELRAVEGAMVPRLAKIEKLSEMTVCRAFRGWSIRLVLGPVGKCIPPAWAKDDICVLGYTEVDEKVIEVPDDGWRNGALAHEMVHAIEWSTAARVGHCQWRERGFKETIRDVTGHYDGTPPGKSCPELPEFGPADSL